MLRSGLVLAYAEWGNASASLNPQSANGSIVQGIQMSSHIGRDPDCNAFITLLSLGAISLALIASLGAISIAPLSLGSLSIGEVSVGAFSRGRWFSYGDDAKGFAAIAKTKVSGDYTALLPLKKGEGEYLYSMLKDNIPWYLRWTLGSIKHLLGL